MPSAALLRKRVIAVLREVVIPDLRSRRMGPWILTQVPLRVPSGVGVKELPFGLLVDKDATRFYPSGKSWPAARMHAMRFPVLVCITEGEADIQFGVTTSMINEAVTKGAERKNFAQQCGGYSASFTAPSYFMLPAGVPVATGAVLPWNRNEPHLGRTSFVYLQFLPVGSLCQLMTMKNGVFSVEYSLFVEDPLLLNGVEILIDEMACATVDQEVVQGQLLMVASRFLRQIQARIPLMTDGLYSRFPEGAPDGLSGSVVDDPLVDRAHKYIQLHLHEPLRPEEIANHVRVTKAQLNRSIRKTAGTSTMGYVNRLRIEAAQLLLQTSSLSVQEIGRLVGFAQQPHFSRLFHAHTGRSPLKFRQQIEK